MMNNFLQKFKVKNTEIFPVLDLIFKINLPALLISNVFYSSLLVRKKLPKNKDKIRK